MTEHAFHGIDTSLAGQPAKEVSPMCPEQTVTYVSECSPKLKLEASEIAAVARDAIVRVRSSCKDIPVWNLVSDLMAARPAKTREQDSGWGRLALVLGAIVAAYVWPLLLRTQARLQLNYNEGWNAARALAASRHQPLYAAPPGLDMTNYPPLSFHIVAWLLPWLNDAVLVGRYLSLAALAGLCCLAALIVRRCVAERHAGWCAGLLLALWLAIWMPSRIGIDDPQVLGMLFECLGFWLFLRGWQAERSVWASAPFFMLALFIKQNLIALPLGAGLSLLLLGRWRHLMEWMLGGAIIGAIFLVSTLRIDGPFFFAHLLQPRAYSWRDVLSQGGDYLLVFLPVLGMAATWSWRHWTVAKARPLILAWLIANSLGFFFSGGDGVGRNVFFEPIFLTLLIAMAACARDETTPAAASRLGQIGRRLLLLFPVVWAPAHFIESLHEWQYLPQAQEDFARGVALLRSTPGPVACDNLLMCVRAGHPSAFNFYQVQDQSRIGRLNTSALASMVSSRQLSAIETGATDLPDARWRERLPADVLSALEHHYHAALRARAFTIWVPAP
jgi:hypothetical protein